MKKGNKISDILIKCQNLRIRKVETEIRRNRNRENLPPSSPTDLQKGQKGKSQEDTAS